MCSGNDRMFAGGTVNDRHLSDSATAVAVYNGRTGAPDRLWSEVTGTPHHGSEWTTGLAVRPDGATLYATGASSLGQGRSDLVTGAYEAR